jgi:tight adherence protein B
MPEVTMVMLLAFGGSVCLFLVLWILVSVYLSRRRAEAQRRIRPADDSDPTLVLNEYSDAPGGPTGLRRLYRQAAERMERTQLRLDVMEAAAITLFCGVVLAAIVFFWRYEEDEAWMAVPAFFLGAAVPLAFFAYRQRTWRRQLQDQLPDMLFLLSRSLRSGMSIDQSIQLLGDHGVAPLSREFARMHRQLDLGLSLPQVLQNTSSRLQLVDFRVFASVLSLHRSTGGSLPVIVDRLAMAVRDHNQMRGYYRSMTSLGRMAVTVSGLLIAVILFYLFFFQRDLSKHYFETASGLTLFLIGMSLQLLGLLLLWLFTRERE